MTSNIPEFGVAVAEAEYILRPGGYAIIFNSIGEIAVVSTPRGFFLPGGGQDAGESLETATVREVREECGLSVSLSDYIGTADELVLAVVDGKYYRKRCTFFLAENVEKVGAGESDHQLIWLSIEKALTELRHESQRWAVVEAKAIRAFSDLAAKGSSDE